MKNIEHAFNHQKVLIVGGAGFVGSNLTHELLSTSPHVKVHIIDNLLSAERVNIPSDPRVSFTEGSIADKEVVEKLQDEYTYIFHLATYHGNQSSIHNPLADHQNNTLTTLMLFEKIKNFNFLKKVVYSGAGCTIAEKTFEETHASKEIDRVSLDMDSPYSISKIIGEFYSKYYAKQHGSPIVRARFQNVYGPREILGAGQWRGTPATIWRNVIPSFIYRSLKQEALPLENEGKASRDFIYVKDIALGLIHCALYGTAGEAYNLASGHEITISAVAEMINKLTGNETAVQYLPKRPWDNSGRRFGCPEKSFKELGFKTQTTFEEGIRLTLQWTQAHLDLIETTVAKHADKMG
ncbi:NAD-dependent epimerase/dehydratase family protein [Parachlamydia sp. AcF125]|uniref:NAD-dependent epimerase/dehydratase family protein n=1 Tax=Parachlamydia sp. AcF125 TaxID=2795736 RepID=UPI001BCA5F03|nr:NAD-dependent epimerase/dehydratase family protein [Parachlamydia sp. AcF125]MBS4167733.1 dTDP-glucose 4,6-dehydratase [Parachlamydia sp. AcF125]